MTDLWSRPPRWFQVAVRPRWIGALVLALIVAAICAGFAQWQLERSLIEQNLQTQRLSELKNQTIVPLESLAKPNQHLPANNTSRLVGFRASLDPASSLVVKDRLQVNGQGAAETGFWLIAKADTELGPMVPVVLGWYSTAEAARAAGQELKALGNSDTQPFSGYLEYPEPPENQDPSTPWMVNSVASAQLVNLWSPEQTIDSYEGFVILNQAPDLTLANPPALVTFKPGDERPIDVNWLNIFYGVEWAMFAGFAFFMWWRLVEDERKKELAAWLDAQAASTKSTKRKK